MKIRPFYKVERLLRNEEYARVQDFKCIQKYNKLHNNIIIHYILRCEGLFNCFSKTLVGVTTPQLQKCVKSSMNTLQTHAKIALNQVEFACMSDAMNV